MPERKKNWKLTNDFKSESSSKVTPHQPGIRCSTVLPQIFSKYQHYKQWELRCINQCLLLVEMFKSTADLGLAPTQVPRAEHPAAAQLKTECLI